MTCDACGSTLDDAVVALARRLSATVVICGECQRRAVVTAEPDDKVQLNVLIARQMDFALKDIAQRMGVSLAYIVRDFLQEGVNATRASRIRG